MADKKFNFDSYYNQLAKLFKGSGPVVYHKVANKIAPPGTNNVPIGTARAFLKHASSAYANHLRSYGQYSRLARYCLAADTLVRSPIGNFTIKELAEKYSNGEKFPVYSFDVESNKVVIGMAHWPHKTKTDKTVKLTFDDGSVVECTADHRFLMRDGTYKQARDIEKEKLMPFISFPKGADEELWGIKYLRRSVVKIEESIVQDVYDMEVEKYHNFGIGDKNQLDYSKNLCFVHNSDYSEMENMAECCAALDIVSDEVCSKGEYGELIRIESSNPTIKKSLNTLFYDTLNIEFNSWHWIRAMCKYGDQFLLVDHHPDFGVVNCLPLPVNEIEREERYDPEDPTAYRYRWVTQGNRPLENWQIVHFRLLGNDAFLPYGMSYLEPARRVWRQLILMEDAVMVYRVTRSSERRVFYIDIGNIAPQDVPQYMEKVKVQLKRNQVVDSDSGRVDLRYNALPIHKDTPVPLLDGRKITIENLAKEYEQGKVNWVYSVRDDDKQIVPGKIVWCGKNYTANKLIKVTTDDGGVVKTAPEHTFVMRNGTKKRADELKIGDSLMPLYIEKSDNRKKLKGYNIIYNPKYHNYNFIHRIVGNEALKEQRERDRKIIDWNKNNKFVVHHKDFNKFNNDPSNLVWMGNSDHSSYHAILGKKNIIRYNNEHKEEKRRITIATNIKYNKGKRLADCYNGTPLHKEHNKIRKAAQEKSWRENKKERSKSLEWIIPDECIENGKEIYRNNPKLNREDFIEEFKKVNYNILHRENNKSKRPISKISRIPIERKLKEMNISGFSEYKKIALEKPVYKNHKVANIEYIDETVDVYCMTIVGPNGEEDRHNFGVCDINNSDKYLIILGNSVEDDFFIPVRGEHSSRIETLPGGQMLNDIEDLQYIQNKLFAALKIPKSYLGYEGDIGSKSTLSQLDVRFGRTIQRIQRVFVSELNKIAIIHLYSMGMDKEDLVNFDITMANPSSISELQRLEVWRNKFEVASIAAEGLLDKHFVYKRLFKLSDQEIEGVEEGRRKDRLLDSEIEQIQAQPPEGEQLPTPELPAGGEEQPALTPPSEEPPETEPSPEAGDREGGLPPPPGEEEQPITASRDPNRQVASPNELIKIKKKKKKKSMFPDLYNHVYNLDKTAMDPKRNASELTRFVGNPFGESVDSEQNFYNKKISQLKRLAEELENIDELKQSHDKNTRLDKSVIVEKIK